MEVEKRYASQAEKDLQDRFRKPAQKPAADPATLPAKQATGDEVLRRDIIEDSRL